jgi:hypothetical protein
MPVDHICKHSMNQTHIEKINKKICEHSNCGQGIKDFPVRVPVSLSYISRNRACMEGLEIYYSIKYYLLSLFRHF